MPRAWTQERAARMSDRNSVLAGLPCAAIAGVLVYRREELARVGATSARDWRAGTRPQSIVILAPDVPSSGARCAPIWARRPQPPDARVCSDLAMKTRAPGCQACFTDFCGDLRATSARDFL